MFEPFLYWSSSNVYHPETFPQRYFSNYENCNMKFPLHKFSDQITICQISFEIYTSFTSNKSFIQLEQNSNIWISFGYFPFAFSFFFWNEVNKKSSIKEDPRFILQECCRAENMVQKIFLEKLLEKRQVIIMQVIIRV